MESKKEEARLAKQYAEKRFSERDFVGAKHFALKAQMLCPELEGISQMVATFDIYVASEAKVNGEIDFYSILGLKSSCDRSMVKKHYKRLVMLLHPDKNLTVGADGAFKLLSEAWTHLSDNAKRAAYDLKRNAQLSSTIVAGANYPDTCGKSSFPPTFWTVCTSCQVQYEYLRKYVNKRLSCKNCRSTFMATELGTAPINGSYPVSHWSFSHDNGYGHSQGYNNAPYIPSSTVYVSSGNSIPSYQSAHSSEFVSNVSFQWSANSGTSTGYLSPNGFTASTDATYQTDGYLPKTGAKRPYKRRKVEVGGAVVNGGEMDAKTAPEMATATENGCNMSKIPGSIESVDRHPIPPPIDIRMLLMDKARNAIRKKLEETKLASAEDEKKPHDGSGQMGPSRKKVNLGITHLEPKRVGPLTLVVPDSDFHDFDNDRTEECFQPKQVWALYDEEDGMPRLYCLIRQVISVNPFKIFVSYLGSKTDTEFGIVNWIYSGFTKSCGHFRATNTDTIEQVNMFSHVLGRVKAGRGGCVRIYPRLGDVWALYRNWSPDWNRSTPYDVIHQYEMVEVIEDYHEDVGVHVAPLLKVDGYKTVYRRNTDKEAIWRIPRREMVRFSHQVPSWLLKDVDNLPQGCWDLDPAAIPDDLLAKDAVQDEGKATTTLENGDGSR